jgi:signal transduction histidine kinase
MIAGAGALDKNIQAQLAYVRDAANRLTEMVDDLVSDAMADALDITIRREPVDIAILVEEVAEANRQLAARKSQTITVSAPPNHAASVDSDRIREAIDNLVSNAVKYSPIGGAIDLLVRRDEGSIIVEVRDQGAGLSPEDISRLFGRFQRLSAKPTAGETSTGLGLSIVKRIIDLHGGRISVDSKGPGKGATFKMTLSVS